MLGLLFCFAVTAVAGENEFTPKPLEAKATLQSLAWSCCSDPAKPQPLWKNIGLEKPDLYIHLGQRFPLAQSLGLSVSSIFKLQSLVPEFVIFKSQVPVVGVWDQNDFGNMSPAQNGKNNPDKESSRLSYLESYPLDSAMIDPKQRGIYHSFHLGDSAHKVIIIMLDTHYFRDSLEEVSRPTFPKGPYVASKNSGKTLLGQEQWTWLEQLMKEPAALRLLISPTPFITENQGQETWALFPHARKNVLDLLARLKIKNLIILSGNRLHGEFQKLSQKNFEVYDFTAGGLNRTLPGVDIPENTRLGPWIEEPNYGLLKINWDARTLTAEIKTAQGSTKLMQIVKF